MINPLVARIINSAHISFAAISIDTSCVLSLLWTLQRASQRYEICLEQYYTLSNIDLFVKASDGGLKVTYPDVNDSVTGSNWDSTHSKVHTPRSVSCKGLEASVSVILTSTRFY